MAIFKEDAPVVEAIQESGADCVFVCLGAPKQELWMARNGPATGAHLLCGLGGSLDVFAGTVERAPKFWSDHGLEWFYRLCKEPQAHRPDDEAAAVSGPCTAGEGKTKMNGTTDRIRRDRRFRQGHPGPAAVRASDGGRASPTRNIDLSPVRQALRRAWCRMYLDGDLGRQPRRCERLRGVADCMPWTATPPTSRTGAPSYEAGGLVIADRYTTSNAVHQASKLLPGERKGYLEWLFDLEYGTLGLPKPDLVLYLDLPTEISEKMMRQPGSSHRHPRGYPRAGRGLSEHLPGSRPADREGAAAGP